MFTDQPVTPARLEVVVDLARSMGERKITQDVLERLVQPKVLPGVTEKSVQGKQAILAAKSLGLLVDAGDGGLRLAVPPRDRRTPREVLLDALDEKVLSSLELEPWLALFYAYLIGRDEGQGGEAASGRGSFWESVFERDVLRGERVSNRFNETKYDGVRRWLRYIGLGWHDSKDTFQPNPYERIKRRLPAIFAGAVLVGGRNRAIPRMDSAQFMARLAVECPELDGGWIFIKANGSDALVGRRCTRALAHALVDLHLDDVIRLDCPADTSGWSLIHAQPPRDQERLRSDRFDAVEWPGFRASREASHAAA